MTIKEMREEIAKMIQCEEGFIATDEKLYEYIDDFIAKVRADAIDEFVREIKMSDRYKYFTENNVLKVLRFEEEIEQLAEQLKEQTND